MNIDFASLDATISSILSRPDFEASDFVADFNAKTLYPASDWKGFTWRYFYQAMDFVLSTSKPLEKSKLEKSFKRFEQLFKDTLIAIDATNKKMAVCYEKSNLKLDSDERDLLRKDVVRIGTSLSSFFDLNIPFSFTQRIKRVQLAFEKVLERQLFTQNDTQLLMHFEKTYAMACVESIVHKPMPQHAFLGLLHGSITTIHQEKLDEWLVCVKDKEVRLTTWLFHQGLAGMLQVMLDKKVTLVELSHHVSSLELALAPALLKRGCKVLENEDQLYTEWLKGLSFQTVIDDYEGERICLGESKQHPTFLSLGLVAFERQGHEDQMVLFGKSVALLGMWDASHQKRNAMVPSVKVLKRDLQGRYLIVEKLELSLDAIQFRRKFGKIAEEDEEKCNEIARLIAWMSSQKVTPKEEFQPAFIFFTSQERLRTLVPLKTDASFDYNQLENFVRITANGNHLALRYIMRESKLFLHPVALFYLKIAEEHLLAIPKHAIREQATLDAIFDPQVVLRAQTMVTKLKELKQKLSLLLIPQLASKEKQLQDRLQVEISKAMIEFQKDTGLPACDWKEKETEEMLIGYLKSERKELFLMPK